MKPLRLHFESHLVPGQIALICHVSRSTVQRYVERLKAAGLSWPLPSDLDDMTLERRLFPPPPVVASGKLSDVVARTKAKYEEGVGYYRSSFGDSAKATASLADARRLLKEARDILDSAGEDPPGGDALGFDTLRTQISRLLYDCNKRSAIH